MRNTEPTDDPMSDPTSPRSSQEWYENALERAQAFFDRLGDEGRNVISLAESEARRLNDNHTGTEHIVWGLFAEGQGVGFRALTNLGVTFEVFSAEVLEEEGPSPEGRIPLTARAVKIVALAGEEAQSLGHDEIDGAHLLLGVIKESEEWEAVPKLGPFHLKNAANSVGRSLEDVRQEVLGLLSART